MHLNKIDTEVTKEMYFNRPQMLAWTVNPSIGIYVMGRATGKTSYTVAPKILRNMHSMPRSVGLLGGPSYTKLLSHMMPEIVVAFETFGMKRDEDFVIGKRPPKNFKKPILPPEKYDNFISLKNGSGFHLLGFDYSTSANALSIQWLALDECKKLPYDRVQKEVLPVLRGGYLLFKDRPEYLSSIFTSDRNIGPRDQNWLDNYKSQASPESEIILICALQARIDSETDTVIKQVLTKELYQRQQRCIYYMEASSKENLANLGLAFFRNQAKSLDADEFMSSILNIGIKRVKGAFYALLDEDDHTYMPAVNNSYIDRTGMESYIYDRDCESDTDWRPDLPIKLSVDLGGHYNWFVVNQLYNDTYYCLNGYWVKAPQKYEDGILQFCQYYSKHKNKTVEFYYDVQANKENARSSETDAKVMIDLLRKNGWRVVNKCENAKYISHYTKYRIWQQVLNLKPNRDKRFRKFRLNMNNAEEVFISMASAPAKEGLKSEIQKDKRSEDPKSGVKPQYSTHLSDAQDNIVCYDHVQYMKRGSGFF